MQRRRGRRTEHEKRARLQQIVPRRLGEDLPSSPAGHAVTVSTAARQHPRRAPDTRPEQAHHHRGSQPTAEPRRHHRRLARECHRRRDQHHRVDRGRRQHEGQRDRARRTLIGQPTRHRHNTTLTPRQRHTGQPSHTDRGGFIARQDLLQHSRRDEGRNGAADHYPEREKRHRLDEDTRENRHTGLQSRRRPYHPRNRRLHHQAEDDQRDEHIRRGHPPACGVQSVLCEHGPILSAKATESARLTSGPRGGRRRRVSRCAGVVAGGGRRHYARLGTFQRPAGIDRGTRIRWADRADRAARR